MLSAERLHEVLETRCIRRLITPHLLPAIRKLREAGHRRICCLSGRSMMRQAGYLMVEGLPVVKWNLGLPSGDGDDLGLLGLAWHLELRALALLSSPPLSGGSASEDGRQPRDEEG